MPLTFEATRAAAATLGSGVIMVFDETVDLVLGNTFSVLSAPPKKAPSSASKPNPSPTGSC